MVSYDMPIGAFCNNKEILLTAVVRICESGSVYSSRAAVPPITQRLGPVGGNVSNVGAEMVGTG